MVDDTLRYWVGFNRVAGVGPVRLKALLDAFGDIASAWEAAPHALRKAGLPPKIVDAVARARSTLDLETELGKIYDLGFEVVAMVDERYPESLRQINSPPIVLYLWGDLAPADRWAAAIVGTRRATPYGKAVARELASGLAASGLTVVSGMARGIDGVAHQAALEAGGRTLAVLGSGLDNLYPPEHRQLAGSISQSGAVLSDYPLGTRPEGVNFPPRNRIIAGLSLATIVIQAGSSSGALITADFALEEGRDVMAVPGRIYDRGSKGTNRLIQSGAFPVTSVEDVLELLNVDYLAAESPVQPSLPADESERKLLAAIGSDPVHIDDLQVRSGLPIAQITACLSMLELRGQVQQVGGMHYVRVREPRASYRVE